MLDIGPCQLERQSAMFTSIRAVQALRFGSSAPETPSAPSPHVHRGQAIQGNLRSLLKLYKTKALHLQPGQVKASHVVQTRFYFDMRDRQLANQLHCCQERLAERPFQEWHLSAFRAIASTLPLIPVKLFTEMPNHFNFVPHKAISKASPLNATL